MRGKSTWHYKPYTRLTETAKQSLPYVCRLAPYADTCELEWMDEPWGAGSEKCAKPRVGSSSPE